MWIQWFICAVLHIFPGSTQSSGTEESSTGDLIPCAKGWFYFRDKCYKLGGKRITGRLNQQQAVQECKNEGGNLVTIQSEEIQDFLVTFLLLNAKTNAWIGLHDRINESKYSWEDGSIVNYTYWEPGEPTGLFKDYEDCVEMDFIPYASDGMTGQWNDKACSYPLAYICESKKSKKSSPDPRFCPDHQGGWKYENSCYHLVHEKKSWYEAEQHCQDIFNGHLLTISDFTVDIFLECMLWNFDREVWVGIKIQEQSLQQWTSGWHVAYSDWIKYQSEYSSNETCSLRSKRRLWKKVPCSKKYSFVCETSSVSPPVLKQPVKGAVCPELPEDWLDLGGEYCYYIHAQNNLNGYEANFDCNRRGGSLVSIHSDEENIILKQFLKYTQNDTRIGLTRFKADENVFVWTDGSHMDYESWDVNEPNSVEENCVSLKVSNMKWYDDDCKENKGYMCSVKKVLPNATEISMQGNCPISPNSTVISAQGHNPSGVSIEVLIGVTGSIFLVIILFGIGMCCFQRGKRATNKQSSDLQLQHAVQPFHRSSHRTVNPFIKEDEVCYENMD